MMFRIGLKEQEQKILKEIYFENDFVDPTMMMISEAITSLCRHENELTLGQLKRCHFKSRR